MICCYYNAHIRCTAALGAVKRQADVPQGQISSEFIEDSPMKSDKHILMSD